MGLQNHNNMNLVLSTDAKPRLKWTLELHQRFVEAVTQLGGAEKATPKSLMRVMGIPGLTLYHLKSHLQKYRLGKSQQSEHFIDNKQEDLIAENKEIKSESIDDEHQNTEVRDRSDFQINENVQIAEALQMQMEVQRKLHDQIEVQKHLQLRIEAQGKYLQSVLRKAQETLARYSSSSVGIETAKAELSRLVMMVSSGCPSSPFSELTEIGSPSPNSDVRKQWKGLCSVESSLTSSESSGRKDEKQKSSEYSETQKFSPTSIKLQLSNIQQEDEHVDGKMCKATGRKRFAETTFSENLAEQPCITRSPQKSGNNKMRKCGFPVTIDLNSICQSDFDSAPKEIDLNLEGK